MLSNTKNIEDSVNKNKEKATATEQSSFIEPSKATPDNDYRDYG